MIDQRTLPDDSAEPAFLVAFLERVAADRTAGAVHDLSHYQAQFPGHEQTLSRAWQRLHAPLAADLPERIDQYVLGDELGRGAQARVVRAYDAVLRREVALKLVPAGPLHAHALARWRREWTALSRVEHPAVCPVYGVGEACGLAWIAMRLVHGVTLAALLDEMRQGRRAELPWRDAVRLIERVARGLHAAHTLGLVHRDIKPSNIMVEHGGAPVVVDFGLARDQRGDDDLTGSGDLLGTPSYMAPEQVAGAAVDARADVHALGVVLFEVLTLGRAFDAPTRALVYDGVRRAPLPLSHPRLRATSRDLCAVLLAATEKDPARRYRDALALADDLCRAAAGEPVQARSVGVLGRTWRWAQRNPLLATLCATAAAALVVAFVALVAAMQAARQKAAASQALAFAAQAQRDAVRAPSRSLQVALDAHATLPSSTTAEAVATTLAALQLRWRRRLYDRGVAAAAFTRDGGTLFTADAAGVVFATDTSACRGAMQRLSDAALSVRAIALDEDEQHLSIVGDGALLRLRRDGSVVSRTEFAGDCAEFTSDIGGRRAAVADARGVVQVLDLERGAVRHTLAAGAPVRALVLHGDGEWLAARTEREVVVWQGDRLDRRVAIAARVPSFAASHDGASLAFGVVDTDSAVAAPMLRVERMVSGDYVEVRARFHNDLLAVAFGPSGQHLAALAMDGRGLWFDLAGQGTLELRGAPHGLHSARLDAHGLLAWGASSVAAWFDDTGALRLLPEHDAPPRWLTRAGSRVLSLAPDAMLRAFASHAPVGLDLGDRFGPVSHATLVSGGVAVVAGHGLALCGANGPRHVASELLGFRALATPGGELVALLGLRGGVAVIEVGSGAVRWTADVGQVFDAAWLGDGSRLVVAAAQRLHVFDRDGHKQGECGAPDLWYSRVASGRASGEFVSAAADGVVRRHDARGQVAAELARHGAEVAHLRCSGDGGSFVSAAYDGSVRVGTIAGAIRELVAPGGSPCTALALADGGAVCVTGHADGTVRHWRLGAGEPTAVAARAHDGAVRQVALHANGWSASGGEDGHVVSFDVQGARLLRYPEHGGPIGALQFSADGAQLLATGAVARLWPVAVDELLKLARQAQAALGD